ncbi:hypothetical protein Tco_0709011 [Tanacetum coccineum]
MKVEESLNMTFDESPPPTKLSPLVDDDVGEEEAIRNNTKVVNNNNEEDESIEVDEVVNIKESKNHPLDQVEVGCNTQRDRAQSCQPGQPGQLVVDHEIKNDSRSVTPLDGAWMEYMSKGVTS